MAGTVFGILSIFDHNEQSWETYKYRIKQWFMANDIAATTDPAGIKTRAVLLSALAKWTRTHKLAADLVLPKQLQNFPYKNLLKTLAEHISPKRCGFGERYNFYAAAQREGETYVQCAVSLRCLTAHCGFSNVEETLRDRFVMGMLPGPDIDGIDIEN